MRLFLALDLSEDVKNYLFNVQSKFKANRYGKINWVFKKNFHITLKFLGDIPEENIKKITNKLKKIKFNKFKVKLKSLVCYPNNFKINVFAVDVESSEKIFYLQRLIDEETISFEDLKLSEHITLGRIKSLKNKKNFLDDVLAFKLEKLQFDVCSFTLYKSVLSSAGPSYSPLETYNLN